ncbi:MAG: hypothetical protein LBB89_13940 [Treponema sp.]|jgi:hypothetical protein|nr:hypothetical protein [Treponema sp.]
MKNTLKLLVLAAGVLLTLAALLLTGCPTDGGDGGDGDGTPPEKLTTEQRWGSWYDNTTSVTIAHSVGDDDVCTITVGGTALTNTPVWDYLWRAGASYKYTAVKDKIYTYSFEAWTDGADRTLNVQWYEDNDTRTYHNTGYESTTLPVFKITSERKTYIITGRGPIPKSGVQILSFQCANQTGTFYVKILEIKEYEIGKLTITNFSGSPGLTQNNLIWGRTDTGDDDGDVNMFLWFGGDITVYTMIDYDNNETIFLAPIDIQITGSSVTLLVWEASYDEETGESTIVPFAGNVTVPAGDLHLDSFELVGDVYQYNAHYKNKVPITFRNGNATINFGTQMEEE